MRRSPIPDWGHAAVIVIAVALLYGQFLANPLVFDDTNLFFSAPDTLERLTAFSPWQIRWLPYATIAWTARYFVEPVPWLRLESLMLHAAAGVALYFFILRLYRRLGLEGERGADSLPLRSLALLAALLFVLHPVAVYGAGYLAQRTIVMATLFGLLALLAYLRRSGGEHGSELWPSALFYLLAVLSKEHAIMLPAAMLALTILLGGSFGQECRRLWRFYLACAGIAAFVVLQRHGILGAAYEDHAARMLQEIEVARPYLFSVLTQCWLFFKYIGLWLLPNPGWMSVDMREPFAASPFSPYLLAVASFLAYGLAASYLLFRRGAAGLAGFALLFPWLMFMTELSTVRIQEPFVLYRSYLWAPGLVVLLPLIAWKFGARLALALPAIVAVFMFPLSMERLGTFSHPLLLWDDAEKLVHARTDLPGANRIYFNRGTEYIKAGRYDDALGDLGQSIGLYPGDSGAHGNLGVAYLRKGDLEQAIRAFSKAIQIDEDRNGQPSPRYYHGRAMAHAARNDFDAANQDIRASCRLAGGEECEKRDLSRAGAAPQGK